MHPKITAELSKLDDGIPFRASTGHAHHTWAKTFHSRPELLIQPESLEEIQKVITLARRCCRRIVVVGCAHSPNDITCTSSWKISLANYARVLDVDREAKTVTVQSGIRLADLNLQAKDYGLTMPNLGSIDHQSIAGAISTATHGSSVSHGLLAESVLSLRIVLANGQAVRCSASQNTDLFRAALVSLGALGIITELTFQMTDSCNIEWTQTLESLSHVLENWNHDLWTREEYTRVWWLPYMSRAIVWRAHKVPASTLHRQPKPSWYGGALGFYTYHTLLYLASFVPPILPWVEWFVFGMQYGFSEGSSTSGVEELRTGLLMDCLYSQFVNEWALPLARGPEAITRLAAWLHGRPYAAHRIPVSNRGVFVHCPVEVRVSDTSRSRLRNSRPGQPEQQELRPYLDPTADNGPTLYLNATLYRPYGTDPPCRERYYAAFEHLMREMGARPHWAKNFATIGHPDFVDMYGDRLAAWTEQRRKVDPEGMFCGDFVRRNVLGGKERMAMEEREVGRWRAREGGEVWMGEVGGGESGVGDEWKSKSDADVADVIKVTSGMEQKGLRALSARSSDESFDRMQGEEAQSMFLSNETREENGWERT
ncbi:MAG: D-arabinono-1,4-lactone oxidase [Bathelium mastoideum]|nr:MAG: D-arabinono-1,4-lactone oxidase [Bathelium mastoideum]